MNSIITFFTQSSEDPAKTSATLTGLLIMAAVKVHQYLDFVPFVHNFFASPVGAQLDPILTAVGYTLGGAWALFGILRKLTNKIEDAKGLRV